jgi:ornithine lipid ester-linked acyl 2-hydroxylase
MIIGLIFLLLFLSIIYALYHKFNKKPHIYKYFYTTHEICPSLYNIHNYRHKIYHEVYDLKQYTWINWPEKNLYENSGTWKIFPFYAFNRWDMDNCKKCPTIYNFLMTIPNLKTASLSKLSPGMKLNQHRGWGSYSNHVIRCHYGIIVPDNCYISVTRNNIEKKQYHKQFKWLIFDDSELHYAENKSNYDRIVLIIDVKRPSNIRTGNSEIGDTSELLEIANHFRNKNIN